MAMKDSNVDYWIIGEGEFRFPRLLDELGKSQTDLASIDGLAYWKDGVARINPPNGFIGGLILAANAVLMLFRKYKHINIFGSKTLSRLPCFREG